ncbi:SMP-30/gluconolactonase/LRE family protein [Bremerella sp. T1]|uniref:SMP-30/gluconolactonase/LRE family protein n=1 Tax=Bremerella sp. TYQ1 TaxID=3119568 RepID=UPI001CCADBB3|nr:SMP-30/gluconolactonase/LRE family protein [Bremerella volcania]UBM37583.1 SMP-30/gluconolactonase/LRE family protein [Bremerella volcania]
MLYHHSLLSPALCSLVVGLLLSGFVNAQDDVPTASSSLRLFATGFAGHSAMCCDGEGTVLATNYRHLGSVGRVDTLQGASIVFDAPAMMADDELLFPLVGISLDSDQRILALDSDHGRILRFSPKSDSVNVLADRFQGRRFDSLFAIKVGPNGNIYFTEPERASGESGTGSVYRFDVATNRPTVLEENLDQPTGICLSSNGKKLFVAESGKSRVPVYSLTDEGQEGKVATYFLTQMLDIDDPKEIGRLGHMVLDRRAWLYIALWDRGEIAIIDTNTGKLLEVLPSGSDRVFGLALWQDALLMSVPGKEAIFRYDLRPLIGRHAP